MNTNVQTDLVAFVKHLVLALRPVAKTQGVSLSFSSAEKTLDAEFVAHRLASSLTGIICQLISFTPENEEIAVHVSKTDDENKCSLVLTNSGIDLAIVSQITQSCSLPVTITSKGPAGTAYEFLFNGVAHLEAGIESSALEKELAAVTIPDFFAEIKKRLRSHFTKSENLVAVLERHNPRDAAFLARVNSFILKNFENTQLDANYLSAAMNMSRTQLFRRLKPIIRQSTGSYIRTIKLQKAKEMFETTDLRISEVAYRTGFDTPSHFTKVFTRFYGVSPSLFCRKARSKKREKSELAEFEKN